jgi:hypothetical protein
MDRREALSGFVLLLGIPVAACSSGDDDSGTGSTPNSCSGAGATTSNVGGHTHFVCVKKADLDSPPTAGATYTTTSNSGHTHTISLTASQLVLIAGGQSVTVTTSTDQGHSHDVSLG